MTMNFSANAGKMLCLNRIRWMQFNRLLGSFIYSAHMYQAFALRSRIGVRNTSQEFLSKQYINISFCGISNPFSSCNTVEKSVSNVKHDPDCKRFYIEVEDMGCAFLEYEREDQVIKLLHTVVPEVLGGRGLGKDLAKAALEYVAKNDFQLEIHCQFVRNYVSKNAPKYIRYLK